MPCDQSFLPFFFRVLRVRVFVVATVNNHRIHGKHGISGTSRFKVHD